MPVLDCRGLPCPEPVIRCRDWLAATHGDSADVLEVLVSNAAAAENVRSFFAGRGWHTQARQEKIDEWRVVVARTEASSSSPLGSDMDGAACPSSPEVSSTERAAFGVSKTLVFIPTDTLGRGDESLGAKLMSNFLGALPEMGHDLWRVILVNGGVKLSAEGPALEKLQALEQAGVSILVCGTCLDHYGLLEKKRVGSTTNMLDIVTSLQLADKVIRP